MFEENRTDDAATTPDACYFTEVQIPLPLIACGFHQFKSLRVGHDDRALESRANLRTEFEGLRHRLTEIQALREIRETLTETCAPRYNASIHGCIDRGDCNTKIEGRLGRPFSCALLCRSIFDHINEIILLLENLPGDFHEEGLEIPILIPRFEGLCKISVTKPTDMLE